MTPQARSRRAPWRIGAIAILVVALLASGGVWSNALGVGDRFERLVARIERLIDPPPLQAMVPTVVMTARPDPSATAIASPSPASSGAASALPSPPATPAAVRGPVDVDIVVDHEAVFASQLTTEWCAVASTQMMLAIMGLGTSEPALQNEIAGRIGEWQSWEDSHDGGWGPAAIASALAAYGAPGYEVVAYESHKDALRDAAIAISDTGRPVALLTWWGAHTWVMTGYRADADPTVFADASISGAYVLDAWYPRVSSIWGPSDPPGTFQDAAELERNWPYGTDDDGWSRLEGAYPERDDRFVVVLPRG